MLQFSPDDVLDITIDGKMEEDSWSKSQAINSLHEFMLDVPLEGHGETVQEWANRSLRCFQSQGVHFVRHTPLHLVKSYVTVPEEEKSIFDGLDF